MPKPRKIKLFSVQLSEILQRRRLAGEKYKDIAAKAGVHPTQVSRLANQDAGVSLCVLDKLGKYLGLLVVEVQPGMEVARDPGDDGRLLEVAAYLDWLRKEGREHADRVWDEARRRLLPAGGDGEQNSIL
jgi:transcriptional regulator with XRE-family HTH domain